MDNEREHHFRRLYEEHADKVLAYARRRVPAEDAPEVVSETFLTVWRRLDVIPDDAVPWLFGVARKVVGNRRRTLGRRAALRVRVEGEARPGSQSAVDPADQVEVRMAARAALARLPERYREALMLVAWEGLDSQTAAAVMGSTPAGFAARLHRARRRLESELAKELPGAGRAPSDGRGHAYPASEDASRGTT